MTEQSPTSPEPSGQPNPEQPVPQPYAQQPYAQQPYAQQPYAQQPYAQQPYANQYSPQYAPSYANQYSPQYAPSYAPAAPTNSMAIVTLIAGIAGLTLLPFVASIVAVITGPMAKRQIAQTGEQGGGMVTAGVVMGWIGIALTILSILAFILFFGLFAVGAGASYDY